MKSNHSSHTGMFAASAQHGATPEYTPAHTGLLQRKCACGNQPSGAHDACDECSGKRLTMQRQAVSSSATFGVPPVVNDVLASSGQPLDAQTRESMESKFGHDFSKVRVHADERAAESARAVDALAYTVGRDVVFAAGQYAPRTTGGQRLLAHELTHVAQQGGAGAGVASSGAMAGRLSVGASDSAAEHEADANAARISTEHPSGMLGASPSAGATLQRQPAPGSGGGSSGTGSGATPAAPIASERGVTLTPHLDPNLIDLTLRVLHGEHRLTLTPSLSNPLNIFGRPIPGMQPPQLSLLVGYENRCNRAFQSALVGMRQRQPAGSINLDFTRNPTEIEARGSFRAGSWLIAPGGTVGFTGSSLDSVLFTLSFTSGVSTQTPPECIAPPPTPTTREPEPPPRGDTPDRTPDGETPDRTTGGDTPDPAPTPSALPSYTLYFFYDTTVLRPESNSTLRSVISMLQTVPSLHVMLTGHASLEGTEDYNMGLSRRRADEMRFMLGLEGIAGARVHTQHFGESAPAVPEPDVSGHSLLPEVERIRNLNRRVEVTFFDPTGAFGSQAPQLRLPTLGWRRPRGLAPPTVGGGRRLEF